MSIIYYKGEIAVTQDEKKEDSKYIKQLINNTLRPFHSLSKTEKYRGVTNVYLKIYYESFYLLQNPRFKNVCISKANELKSEIENDKSNLLVDKDNANYLISLLSLFLKKYSD